MNRPTFLVYSTGIARTKPLSFDNHMLEIIATILLVSMLVLVLFRLVRWLLGFVPGLNSPRMNPPTGKWWILLLLVVLWLVDLVELLNQGSFSEWGRAEYSKLFYWCALTYGLVIVWRWTQETHGGSHASGASVVGRDDD